MKIAGSITVAFFLVGGWAGACAADPILWPKSEGGNDHYYEIDLDARSFEDARTAAAALEPPEGYAEGHLVTITSSAEQTFVAAEFPPLASCLPFNGPCIWMDLSDEAAEGTFVWLDGIDAGLTLQQAGYSNWVGGEPNNSGGENCAVYGWNGTTQWNDVPCDGLDVAIVEWEPLLQSKLILWPSSEGGNDHYYYLDASAARTLEDARAAASTVEQPAEDYGEGHLVTITSAEEQAFIVGEFPPLETCRPFQGPCIWIDASDAQTEGQFQWLDGPEAGMTFWPQGGYSNWSPSEPNDFGGEDCAIYGWNGTTQWNDGGCQGMSLSIVEWEMLPPRACGDATPPDGITAPDALYVLRSAVGTASCDLCVCDVDGGGTITAPDALRVLRHAVGQNVELQCPACG